MAKVVVKESRKELWIWRIVFLSLVAYFALNKFSENKQEIKEDSIVRTELYGEIFYDDQLLNNIYDLADNDKVKGVLLKVNCPGGEITGSEAVYKAFSYVSSKKPLVASIQSAAASGGYMAILAANKIYSYDTSIVGSIGVITAGFLDISGLEEKLGVKFFNYKSSPLKSLPDGYEMLGMRVSKKPEGEADRHMQNTANEFQALFKKMVSDNRPQIKDVEYVSSGAEFTGRKGLELGLIDVIGNDRDAIGDLQTNFNLKAELPIVDYNIIPPREESRSFFAKIIKIIWN